MTTIHPEDLAALRAAQVPRFCPGTGAVIRADRVNGDHITTCPEHGCRRWVEAFPIPDDGQDRWTVEAHFPRPRPRHEPYCYDDEGKLECACGLDIVDAQLAEEQAARYTAGKQVVVDLPNLDPAA